MKYRDTFYIVCGKDLNPFSDSADESKFVDIPEHLLGLLVELDFLNIHVIVLGNEPLFDTPLAIESGPYLCFQRSSYPFSTPIEKLPGKLMKEAHELDNLIPLIKAHEQELIQYLSLPSGWDWEIHYCGEEAYE